MPLDRLSLLLPSDLSIIRPQLYFPIFNKDLAIQSEPTYNVLHINTMEAMYEQGLINKSHGRARLKTI